MAKIHVLSDSLIDKIAAGEVVEQPASVVKELVENSIDAHATTITIELEKGGTAAIRIIDNGDGMTPEDAKLSVIRHATSKVTHEDDLFAIKTLGFRGEALASISAVSKFSLITRTADTVVGTRVYIEKEMDISEIGCEKGTRIEVSDLFYNVPARKKFLRSEQLEYSKCADVITHYALAYPGVSFILKHNGKVMMQTSATDNWLNTIQTIYGSGKEMLEIDYHDELFTLRGFIGKPSLSRGDKNRQVLFINGRYVTSKEIAGAIKEGYSSMLFLEREPVYVLHMSVDEKKIDVNVHPRKEIVKLSLLENMTSHISHAVTSVLQESDLILNADLESESSAKPTKVYSFETGMQTTLETEKIGRVTPATASSTVSERPSSLDDPVTESGSVYEHSVEPVQSKEVLVETNDKTVTSTLPPVKPDIHEQAVSYSKIGKFRILGQVNKMYIIAESDNGIMIVDQHAAEERVNYEKLMKQLQTGAIKTQQLLEPMVIELPTAEYERIIHYKDELEKVGFAVDDMGQKSIVVRTMPFIFERPSKAVIEELIQELGELKRKNIDTAVEDRIIRFSCRMSIKAGDVLHISQMEKLLTALDACDIPFTCPHGRPTIIRLGLTDIEKKFKRS